MSSLAFDLIKVQYVYLACTLAARTCISLWSLAALDSCTAAAYALSERLDRNTTMTAVGGGLDLICGVLAPRCALAEAGSASLGSL